MKKILITEVFHPFLKEGLEGLGYQCNEMGGVSYAEVKKLISGYEGMVVATRIIVDKGLIDEAPLLKFIARAGSGMENIDVPYAESRGIRCISSPEGNANSVGEHALGLLLSMFHNIVRSHAEITRGHWKVEENRTRELEGKTIGIIGYGNTGKSFASKLRTMSMKILAYDKYLSNYGDEWVREADMAEIFSEADIISLHIPLTPETRMMVDDSFLQRFRKSVHLINTSRGMIIRHRDLLNKIREGRITGAACDVYENEDFERQTSEEREVFRGLIETGKVIFTPHIAGKSFEGRKKIAEVLISKIMQLS